MSGWPRVEGEDIEALERTVRNADVGTHLIFVVALRTTAAPENQHRVSERFKEELKLQFGSAVSVRNVSSSVFANDFRDANDLQPQGDDPHDSPRATRSD